MSGNIVEIATVFSEIESCMSKVIEDVEAKNSVLSDLLSCPLSILHGGEVIFVSNIESNWHLI